MEVFVKALKILAVLAICIGVVVLIYNIAANSEFLNDWGTEMLLSGLITGFIMAILGPFTSFIATGFGDDENTAKAVKWICTIIAIVLFVVITIWFYNNANM